MKTYRILALAVCASLAATAAQAYAPQRMNFQGWLKNSAGVPLPDGLYQLQFSIWDADCGFGSQLWSEVQATVPLSGGLFNAVLGSSSAIAGLNWDTQYYLQVEVWNSGSAMYEALCPRHQLTTAGWAFRVETIDGNTAWTPPIAITGSNPSSYILYVQNTGANGTAVYGDAAGGGLVGLYGNSNANGGAGVYGVGASGAYGVLAESSSAAGALRAENTAGGRAVTALNSGSGRALYAESNGDVDAIQAVSNYSFSPATNARALDASGNSDIESVRITNNTGPASPWNAAHGLSVSTGSGGTNASAIVANNTGAGAAVKGTNNSSQATVQGTNSGGGNAVYGNAVGGGQGVYGTASGNVGIRGTTSSTAHQGGSFENTAAAGAFAPASGVLGLTHSTSENAAGVVGTNDQSSGTGVIGAVTNSLSVPSGVRGGVVGISNQNISGVYGYNLRGATAPNTSAYGVYAYTDSTGGPSTNTAALRAQNAGGGLGGYITTASASSPALLGHNLSGGYSPGWSGAPAGIWGATGGAAPALWGTNGYTAASSSLANAVRGQADNIGAAAGYFWHTAASGANAGAFGAYGQTASTHENAAGVKGASSTGTGTGVLGTTNTSVTAPAGVHAGVVGLSANSSIPGIYAYNGSGSAAGGHGVYAHQGTTNANNAAVYADNVGTGYGVYGRAAAIAQSAGRFENLAAAGANAGANGVHGITSASDPDTAAVKGYNTNGQGVLGITGAGSAPAGMRAGVSAVSTSGTYPGLHATNTGSGGNAIFANVSSGTAVRAEYNSAAGVGGYGIYSTATVTGTNANVFGTYSTSSHPSWDNYGGYFTGTCGGASAGGAWPTGVYGTASAANTVGGAAVRGGWFYAYSSGAANTNGTYGAYMSAGSASNTTGTVYGVYSDCSNGANGYAGYFQRSTGFTGYALYASGNFLATGGSKSCGVETSQGWRELYCMESPEIFFEDFGTARLTGGRADVSLDSLFLETVTISDRHPMKVFVQPYGNCKGLYVERGPSGFSVRELGGGASSVSFEWRVIAKRKGFEDRRLRRFELPAPPSQADSGHRHQSPGDKR